MARSGRADRLSCAAISRRVGLPTTCLAAVFLLSCSSGEPLQPLKPDSEFAADVAAVSSKRVYFGHQSVGGNVLAGLDDLQRSLKGPVIRVGEIGAVDGQDGHGILLHTAIGKNEDPVAKCQDFRSVLGRLQGNVDVALFKFCYIDFSDQSDVDEVFSTYARTMDDMKQQYPDVTFIHVTAPLRTVDRGPGVWAREMLGRPNRQKIANVRRNEFNRLVRERYAADPIFDLAAVMSTYPDGRRETFTWGGQEYYSLVPAYTYDGGHLNEVGRSYAAAGLVRSIAAATQASG